MTDSNKDADKVQDTIWGMPRWFVIIVLVLLLVYIIYIGYKNGHFAGFGGPSAGKLYHLSVPSMGEFDCVSEFVFAK